VSNFVFSESRGEVLPKWMVDLPPGPVVHATLGTVADRPDLLRTIIEGLADESLTLIVATGPRSDPMTLGALPPNVRVAAYISHEQLLPRCGAIITHAGAGTLIASINLGLPLLLIPLFSDQPANAEMAEAAGVALILQPSAVTPAAVREATYALLNESRREQFSALRQEIALLPPVERAVGWLEQIARDRAPLPLEEA
jgi:MGT family glycosyltransferase